MTAFLCSYTWHEHIENSKVFRWFRKNWSVGAADEGDEAAGADEGDEAAGADEGDEAAGGADEGGETVKT